jgi:hypothetical protein
MNGTSPIDPRVPLVADVLYKSLISTVRSQDASLSFYSMELEAQKSTEVDYKKFAFIYANLFVKSVDRIIKRSNIEISKKQRLNLVKRCLKKAWEQYNNG